MSEQADTDKYDHTFKAIHDDEVEWESDDVRGLLTLPEGVQVKVLNYDPVMKRLDMKQRFPRAMSSRATPTRAGIRSWF